jgi:hypothetical protein
MTSKTILGLFLVVLAAALAGGGIFAAKSYSPAKIDAETLCPLEGPNNTTLVIVDKTDPLTSAEQARAREILATERGSAKRGDRIAVKLLKPGDGTNRVALDTIVDLCNPGAEANPFFENPKRVYARYESAFLDPIDAALESLGGEGSASASPIAQAIQLSLEGLGAARGRHVKIILISDLMEHGPEVSAYTGGLTAKALHKLLPNGEIALLRGADVNIVLLSRPRYETQQKTAVIAWRQFFADTTGKEPGIALPGARS